MRKILFIFIVFLSTSAIANAQSGWFPQTSPSNKYLYSVYFVDQNTGYVGGDTLLKTTNAGSNWIAQTMAYSGAVFFQNINTGFIGYINGAIRGIEMTTNAGLNWNIVMNTYPLGINSFSFINALTGWAAAGAQFQGAIYKTTNGGLNWFSILNNDGQLYVQFVNANTGFSVGYYTGVKKSTNGGINWTNISPGNYGVSVFAVDTNIVYGGGSSGHVFRSTNGGLNWDSLHTGTNANFYSFYFFNANTGYMVGSLQMIMATTNGGANWVSQHISGSGNLFNVFFVNSATGWAVGDNGAILKTTTGGVFVGLQPVSENIPSRMELHQNYPNPFNPSTVIRFSLPNPSEGGAMQTKIVIYDALGREAAILVNEPLKAGEYEVTWNASAYPSGIYFARLSAGSFGKTMKMTLLK